MTWSERVQQFEQTAPKARLMAAGFALGAIMSVLFAPLHLTRLTTEDALSYAFGLPMLAVSAFVFIRLLASARKRFALLFLVPWVLLVVGFMDTSNERVLNDRGEHTEAVVVQRVTHPRSSTTYKLVDSNGEDIPGELSKGGPYDEGDRLKVVADPMGKVDPVPAADLSDTTTATRGIFGIFCAFLLLITTWGAASVFKNRPQPSAPPGPPRHVPPPPPPPGPAGGFRPPPPPGRA